MRVLVIEDDPDCANSLADLLTLMGHQVTVAYDGAEGLAAAVRTPPEVILCNLCMPGMCGYSVAGKLRRHPATAGVRLIAVSGYGHGEYERRSVQAGFERHLVKPVFPEVYRAVLGTVPSDWGIRRTAAAAAE